MKRILSLILSFVIAFTTVAFSKVSVNNASDYKTQLKTLSALGVVDASNVSRYQHVTREQFIACVVGLHGTDGAANVTTNYMDIDTSSPFYNSIGYATAFGLVSGDENGYVHPTDEITAYEASVILIRLLGYGNVGNYEKYAQTTSVLCGENDMTWENVVKILYKMLDRYVVKMTVNDDGAAKFEPGTETVLGYYRDIYEFDGILTSVGKTHLTQLTNQPNSICTIDDVSYDASAIKNLKQYIGYRIQGYYYKPNSFDEGALITVLPYQNDVVVIEADDVVSYVDHVLRYDGGTRIKDLKTSTNFDVVYNFAADVDFSVDDVLIQNGSITAIDNDDDGYYDVLNIVEYKNYVVSAVDSANSLVYLKYPDGNKTTLDLSEKGREINFINTAGFATELADLSLNDVISVYESKEGDYLDVSLCVDEVEGKVSAQREDDGNLYITVDDTEYRVAEPCSTYQKSDISVGTNGVFVLDIAGKIAFATKDSNSLNGLNDSLAYLINIYNDTEHDERIHVRLLLQDNTIVDVPLRERCEYNGQFYTNVDKLWAAMGGMELRHRVVMVSANGNGEISRLITDDKSLSYGGFDKFISTDQLSSNPIYKRASGLIDDKIAITGSTTVFIVPSKADVTADKYYSVNNNYFTNDKAYFVDGYRVSEDSYVPSVVVYYENVSDDSFVTDQDAKVFVLDRVSRAVNEDGINVSHLTMYGNTGKVELNVESDDLITTVYADKNKAPITPTRGDVIRYEERDGAIVKLDLVYSKERDGIIDVKNQSNHLSSSNYARFQVWEKYVFFRFNGFIAIVDDYPTDYDNFDITTSAIHNCSSPTVIVVDTVGKDGVYMGSQEDILGYKNTLGAACSKVVIYERYGEPQTIVVYK